MENIEYIQENNKKISTISTISYSTSKSVNNARLEYEIPKKRSILIFIKKYTVPYLKFICNEFKLKKRETN